MSDHAQYFPLIRVQVIEGNVLCAFPHSQFSLVFSSIRIQILLFQSIYFPDQNTNKAYWALTGCLIPGLSRMQYYMRNRDTENLSVCCQLDMQFLELSSEEPHYKHFWSELKIKYTEESLCGTVRLLFETVDFPKLICPSLSHNWHTRQTFLPLHF